MTAFAENAAIRQKTIELCQAILDQPEFQSLRLQMDQFLADDAAQSQYQQVVEKSQTLQQKQRSAQPLTPEEIAAFESDREALMNNSVARGFLDAQEGFHHMQETVQRYVSRTFELGRLPAEDDFAQCGQGCSCGH